MFENTLPPKVSYQNGDRVGRLDRVGQVAAPNAQQTNRFKLASEIQPTEMRWLWPGMVPLGCLTIIEGVPGQGKSAIAYDLASCVSAGLSIPFRDAQRERFGVVILAGEDPIETKVVSALDAAGADRSRIIILDDLMLPRDLQKLKAAAGQVTARLIVIDPIAVFFETNLSSDQSARKVLTPLARLAKELHLAIVLINHLVKYPSSIAEYRGAGSIGIIGVARSGLRVEHDATERPFHHMLTCFKANFSRGDPFSYRTVKDQAGNITVQWIPYSPPPPLASLPGVAQPKSKLDAATDFLLQTLGSGPMLSNEVFELAARSGIARKTLERAKQQARILDWKKGYAGSIRTFWELPKVYAGFFSQTAHVIGQLLEAGFVESTKYHPRVIVENDQITIVIYHVDGNPILLLTVEGHERSATLVIEREQFGQRLEVEQPNFWLLFKEVMKQCGLVWGAEDFDRLTSGPADNSL
jgi:hypothetical protein